MANITKGFKRLGLLIGAVGEISWLIYFLFSIVYPRGFDLDLFIFLVITLAIFFVPYGLTRTIGWVIQGFKSPPSE